MPESKINVVRVYHANRKVVVLFILNFLIPLLSHAQINDNCSDAVALTVGSSCVSNTYSNENATAESSAVAPDPSCGTYAGGDVWFTVVMPSSGALRIETESLTGTVPPSYTVYSGTCGNFNEVHCARNNPDKTIVNPDLGGETLYIRMYTFGTPTGKPFWLCVFEPIIPVNDDCENAIALIVEGSCQPVNFTNEFATQQSTDVADDPTCSVYAGGDVWFTAVMPASGGIQIQTEMPGSAVPPSVTIYSGACGSFTEVFCTQNNSTIAVYKPELTGETLYLRLHTYGSEEGRTFTICLAESFTPPNDNCASAIILETASDCQSSVYSNVFATAESQSIAPDPTCETYAGSDVWFTATMPLSGSLAIETSRIGSTVPPSFTVYSGTCGNFAEVHCTYNDGLVTLYDPSLAGETLYLRVYSYNSEDGRPFSLCVYEVDCVPVEADEEVSICEGGNFIFGGDALTEAGEYMKIFETTSGCDSVVNLTLNINPVYHIADTVTICAGEHHTFPDNTTIENITEPVLHTSVLASHHQCDSMIDTYVNVLTVNTNVTQQGMRLTADAGGATYQWLDCNDQYKPVEGETNISFTADHAGSFAVLISEHGCVDTSACYVVAILNVHEDERPQPFTLYPNPATDHVTILFDREYRASAVKMINSVGQFIPVRRRVYQNKLVLETDDIPPGVYILDVVLDGSSWRIRQVISHVRGEGGFD